VGFVVPGVGSSSNGDGASSEAGYTTGRVDLVFRQPEGVVVLDYKTDAVGAAAMESHAGQAQAYCRGVGAATGLEVNDVVLVFARTGAEARLEQ
jgi:ATP-dependent exoDNAse (exonuclease V) beta subunit